MRSASVGQQCVECVGEGARSTRQARTTFGGRPAAGAVVTWTLVAINVAVFLVTWVRPGIVNDLEMLGYAAYVYAPRKNRAAIQIAATVAVVALIAVAVAVRNGQLTSGGL